MGELAGVTATGITHVSVLHVGICDHFAMANDRIRRQMMLYHLEAASAYAEETGDVRVQEIIERAKRDVEQKADDLMPIK